MTTAAQTTTQPVIRSGRLSAFRARLSEAATAELLGPGERKAPEPLPHERATPAS